MFNTNVLSGTKFKLATAAIALAVLTAVAGACAPATVMPRSQDEVGLVFEDRFGNTSMVRSGTEIHDLMESFWMAQVDSGLVSQSAAERLLGFWETTPRALFELRARFTAAACDFGATDVATTLANAGITSSELGLLAGDVSFTALEEGSILSPLDVENLELWLEEAEAVNLVVGVPIVDDALLSSAVALELPVTCG